MSQTVRVPDANPHVSRTSLFLLAAGFFMFAIGASVLSWIPALSSLEFVLQSLGPVLVVIALLIGWRIHVARWGWWTFILFLAGILAYGAVWLPYAIAPEILGSEMATQRGFLTAGVSYLCAATGLFLLMARGQRQLSPRGQRGHLTPSATFTQLLLLALGVLLNGVDLIWVGPTGSKLQEFSLMIIGWALILVSAILSRKLLTARFGRPAAVVIILSVLTYWLHFFLDVLPSWVDPEWRQSLHVMGAAFMLAAIAFILVATRKSTDKTSSRR